MSFFASPMALLRPAIEKRKSDLYQSNIARKTSALWSVSSRLGPFFDTVRAAVRTAV